MHEFPDALPGPAPALLAPLAELRRRLRAEGRPVAVLCLGASGRASLERNRPERVADLDGAIGALLEALPAGIRRSSLSSGGEHLVLIEADAQAAALCAELLVEQGREWTPDEGERPVWAGAHVGLALDSDERGFHLETLIAVAREGAAVARNRGGECVVHTRLYELVQRRLERELGVPAPAPTRGTVPMGTPSVERSAAAIEPADTAREELEQRLAARLAETASLPRAARSALLATDGSTAADPQRAAARRLVAEAFDEERRELERRHREEVELLEQRIRRLLRSLEETEAELRRLSQVAGQDPGVPSVYRTIQGLAEGDLQHAVKRELMAQLLEANLELRRRIAGSAA